MLMRGKRQQMWRRRATVMAQSVIFGGAVGVGMAALAVDTGLMFSAKQELQSAADAAALAAASQLGAADASTLALAEASTFSGLNKIMGTGASVVSSDMVLGHAVMNGEKFDFQAGQLPYDAVRITLRRQQGIGDGPVSLLFAKTFGMSGASLQASATAMLVPRDIALVIDLSGSMNDDSELRHHKQFASEKTGYINGVQINLTNIWNSIPVSTGKAGIQNGQDPSAPGAAGVGDNQPATGAGAPQLAGGNPDPGDEVTGGSSNPNGPRFGWMTGWGDAIVLGSYNASSDSGLHYIKRYRTCSDADVIENLTTAGYTSSERSALLSGSYDSSSSRYKRRVQVLLGLAGWKSGKSNAKYSSGGDGDNYVDSNELTQTVSYPFSSGSWDHYAYYVMSSWTRMARTDSDLRYRFGLKTFINYLLEWKPRKSQTEDLYLTPEEPLYSVKGAVQTMIDEIIFLDTQDHVSLETFGQYGRHRLNLSDPTGSSLAVVLQEVPDDLNTYQAGHDYVYTNIGSGIDEGIDELTSVRARTAAAKVVILLTDGKPNVNQYNSTVGNNHPQAIGWATDRADAAKAAGMTVYTIGVGGDVDEALLGDLASSSEHYFFADNAPDPSNNGEPLYVNQLKEIFQTLGGKRPVRLIQ